MPRSFVLVYARMTDLRADLDDEMLHDILFIMKVQIKRSLGDLGPIHDIVNRGLGKSLGQKTLIGRA